MPADRPCLRAAWIALLLSYLGLAFLFSIIQPLGRTPDEAAHVQYVKFIADNGRLPFFEPQGGGEGGYEAQHPPLYYTVMAAVYAVSHSLEERWRWHVLRWGTVLLIGLPMFFTCRRFFGQLYPTRPRAAFICTATVMLMPLTLLYTAYVNPDAMAMLWASLVLLLAVQPAGPRSCGAGAAGARRALLLGLLSGAALLTKLSAAPVLIVAVAGHARRDESGRLHLCRSSALLTLLVALVLGGWWYARNAVLYGTPLIHTLGRLGSGLQFGFMAGFGQAAWLTIRETYLSSWVQRGWFPEGAWTIIFYGLIMAMTLLAAVGLIRGKLRRGGGVILSAAKDIAASSPAAAPTPQDDHAASMRRALNLSGLLLGLVVLGHQWAYWTMDVEFNAGGRYVLVAMTALALLLVEGVRRALRQRAIAVLWLWLAALLAMNQVSVWHIWAVLNPRYAPGWQIFHFP